MRHNITSAARLAIMLLTIMHLVARLAINSAIRMRAYVATGICENGHNNKISISQGGHMTRSAYADVGISQDEHMRKSAYHRISICRKQHMTISAYRDPSICRYRDTGISSLYVHAARVRKQNLSESNCCLTAPSLLSALVCRFGFFLKFAN